jgi:hypothetical protein
LLSIIVIIFNLNTINKVIKSLAKLVQTKN